jgi:hypothetical protein
VTDARLRPGARTWTATAQGCEFRLDIFVDPDSETAAAILYYQADGLAAAIAQARRFLAAHPGPDDRYGELHQRHGDLGDYLADIHLAG